jgi:pimeloyl-ACP methyl ester carboxylesterase
MPPNDNGDGTSITSIPVISNIPSAEEDIVSSNIATIFSPLSCIKRGHCDVGSDSLRLIKSHRLYYELHGSTAPDAEKVLLIMGLNNSCFVCDSSVLLIAITIYVTDLVSHDQAWHSTLEYLTAKGNYQVLCFDNRGVGHSEHSNDGRFYKTTQMASDVEELLHLVGWIEPNSNLISYNETLDPTSDSLLSLLDDTVPSQFSVVGISMGGMIALELALLIPERINALILTSTKSGNARQWPTARGTYFFTKLMLLAPLNSNAFAVDLLASVLFPDVYLNADNGKGGTHRDDVVAVGHLPEYWPRYAEKLTTFDENCRIF